MSDTGSVQPQVQNTCRLCGVSLLGSRGTLGGMRALFGPTKENQKTRPLWQRFSAIGVSLVDRPGLSPRICSGCYRVFLKVELCMATLKRWQAVHNNNNSNRQADTVVEEKRMDSGTPPEGPPINLSEGPPINLSKGLPINRSKGPPIKLSKGTPTINRSKGPPIKLSKGTPTINRSKGPPIKLSKGTPINLAKGPPINLSEGPPIILSIVGPPIILSKVGPPIILSKGPPIILSKGPPIILSQGPHILSQGPPILSQGPPILSEGPPIMPSEVIIHSEGPPIMPSEVIIHSEGPPIDPSALKKRRCPDPSPLQMRCGVSTTEVFVQYPSKRVRLQCHPDVAGIIVNLAKGNWRTAAKKIVLHEDLLEEMKPGILQIVERECRVLCDHKQSFVLRRSPPDQLRTFSFAALSNDLKRLAPLISSIFSTITKRKSRRTACAAAAIALRGRENRLSAFAYYINSVLQFGGAKKSVFKRLSKLRITTSHSCAIRNKLNSRRRDLGPYRVPRIVPCLTDSAAPLPVNDIFHQRSPVKLEPKDEFVTVVVV